jgi:hypothetical protein
LPALAEIEGNHKAVPLQVSSSDAAIPEIVWSKVFFIQYFCPFSTRMRFFWQIFILERLLSGKA